MMKKLLVFIIFLFLFSCNSVSNPIITLPVGNDILDIYTEHIDEGCYLKIGIKNQAMTVLSSTVDTNIIGEYEIVYQTVYKEITYTAKRIVLVVDKTSPEATLIAGIDTVKVNTSHIDMGITATDNYDTELTITIENMVNISMPGTYSIVYTLVDDFNNKTQITRIVTVVE